jgi:hypothetical protein
MKPTLNEQLARMQKIAGIITENQTNEGYDEFQRADKGSKGVTAKDKGEEEVYGAGVKKGEKIEKEKMTKSKFKEQIKEMILAELTEDSDEDINITNDSGDYDPLAENNPDENEDDVNIDDYDENYSDGYIDDYDTEYDLGIDEAKDYNAQSLYNMFKKEDLLNDRREYDVEDLMNSYPGLSQEEAEKLEDMLQNPLDEAKKDEEVEDITVDDTEVVDAPASDIMAGESAEVSGIQANLQAAYAEAKALGDEKLITQIANTITYFTKAHILDTAPINENMFPMLKRILR